MWRGGHVPVRKQALPHCPLPCPLQEGATWTRSWGEGAEVFFIYVYIFFFKL